MSEASEKGSDFSGIDSPAKAEELFREGVLEKVFLIPLEFGAEDHPFNTLYVPVGVGAAKARIDNGVIAPLAAEGAITRYSAMPEYQAGSVVPIAIKIVASGPREFTTTISIWGEALTREKDA